MLASDAVRWARMAKRAAEAALSLKDPVSDSSYQTSGQAPRLMWNIFHSPSATFI